MDELLYRNSNHRSLPDNAPKVPRKRGLLHQHPFKTPVFALTVSSEDWKSAGEGWGSLFQNNVRIIWKGNKFIRETGWHSPTDWRGWGCRAPLSRPTQGCESLTCGFLMRSDETWERRLSRGDADAGQTEPWEWLETGGAWGQPREDCPAARAASLTDFTGKHSSPWHGNLSVSR